MSGTQRRFVIFTQLTFAIVGTPVPIAAQCEMTKINDETFHTALTRGLNLIARERYLYIDYNLLIVSRKDHAPPPTKCELVLIQRFEFPVREFS